MKDKGITLIALVITIIVLIILAGVSINLLLGDNGLINRALNAKEVSNKADVKEKLQLAVEAALIRGLGELKEENLETELNSAFGNNNYDLSKTDGVWTITANGYEFEVSEDGNVVLEESNNNTNTTPSQKNEYGFYFDELYEGTVTQNSQTYKTGYIFHADGSYHMFYGSEAETQNELICKQIGGTGELNYAQLTSMDGVVSEDGLTIIDPYTGAELKCNFEDISESGIAYGNEYTWTFSGYSDSYAANVDGEITLIFYEDGSVNIVETYSKDGTVLDTYNKSQILAQNSGSEIKGMAINGVSYISNYIIKGNCGGVDLSVSLSGNIAVLGEWRTNGKFEILSGGYTFACTGPTDLQKPDDTVVTAEGYKVTPANGSSVENIMAGNPITGDTIEYNGYIYRYNKMASSEGAWYDATYNGIFVDGWGVRVKDTEASEYSPMLSSIYNDEVKLASYVYYECSNMTTAPEIPSSITVMDSAFGYCTKLTGTVTINAENLTTHYELCFYGTVLEIELDGSCSKLSDLAATANNGNVTVKATTTE